MLQELDWYYQATRMKYDLFYYSSHLDARNIYIYIAEATE